MTQLLQSKLTEHLLGNQEIIVLNKPGGGSVTTSNDFHQYAPKDGTTLIMASTSSILPVLLGSSIAEFDPNEWLAVADFARSATLCGIVEQTGADNSDPKAAMAALNSADFPFGLEIPIPNPTLKFNFHTWIYPNHS